MSEPVCVPPEVPPPDPVSGHTWQVLGREDNGETVSRCSHCKTLRYELNGAVRYETPGA